VQDTCNINVRKLRAIMVQIVMLVQVRIVTHYKYELARLALLAPKCNPYLRCYRSSPIYVITANSHIPPVLSGMKNACMYVLSTELASVYISKILKLLTRAVLFIANYAWYLAKTMYLLIIHEPMWIITLSIVICFTKEMYLLR